HRTLRNAIGWSYDLCTEAERTLWARLSVFADAFNVAAAREVCVGDGLDGDDILDTIIRLVDKSVLLRARPATVGTGCEDEPAWYRMLDTIHEFGDGVLHARGERDAVREAFTDRYLAMARHFASHLTDDVQLERFRELRGEHGNIRAALTDTLDDKRAERIRLGAELANALYGYWHMSGLLREGRHWYRKALDALPEGSARERGWALVNRGYLGAMQGEAVEAVSDASAGIAIGKELDDDLLIGRGYAYLTLALTIADNYDEAREAARQAERTLESLGDRTGLAILDCHWAHLSHLAGDPQGALRYGARAASRFGGAREWWASAWSYAISAMALYADPRRDAEATRALNKSLQLKHELGDMVGTAYCLEIHGWLAARSDRHVRAAWLLGAAAPLWELAGGRLGGTAALLRAHEESMASCREALGARRFESLFARGGKAPRDDTVALALNDAEPDRETDAEPDAEPPDESRPRPGGRLTAREKEIACLVAAGLSNRQIAETLFISRRTVDAHVEHIFGKLEITSRVMLTIQLREHPAIADTGATV
ncbi:MAG: ATP-binding protein, partial [Sciscionella sp.]